MLSRQTLSTWAQFVRAMAGSGAEKLMVVEYPDHGKARYFYHPRIDAGYTSLTVTVLGRYERLVIDEGKFARDSQWQFCRPSQDDLDRAEEERRDFDAAKRVFATVLSSGSLLKDDMHRRTEQLLLAASQLSEMKAPNIVTKNLDLLWTTMFLEESQGAFVRDAKNLLQNANRLTVKISTFLADGDKVSDEARANIRAYLLALHAALQEWLAS